MGKSNNKRTAKHTRPAGHTEDRAKYWCVSVRVMQQWLKRAVPVEDDAAMVQWYARLPVASQRRLSAPFQKRITEVRMQLAAGGTGLNVDPDLSDFEAHYRAIETADADKTALADLKKQQQFFLYKQRVCSGRGESANADHALKQLSQLSSIIHDMELRDQKLGRDLGDLVPRHQAEAPLHHIAYHLLRCADATLATITQVLTRRDPTGAPLLAEEIHLLLEPILLDRQILQPIRRASHGTNPAAPPPWAIAALEAGLSEVLESPPTPPAAPAP